MSEIQRGGDPQSGRIQHSEIIYEEGWRQNAPTVLPGVDTEETPIDEQAPTQEKPERSVPLLISVQLVLCLLSALLLFLLKAMQSEHYYDFMDFYHEELQKPVVSQGVFDMPDISRLFGDDVTVRATPDEAQAR